MQHTTTYIIIPRPQLCTLVSEQRFVFADMFLDKHVWDNEEGGYTYLEPEDYPNAVKRIFVAYVSHAYLQLHEIALLFDSAVASESAFDRWWELITISSADEHVQVVVNNLAKWNVPNLEKIIWPFAIQR